MIPDKSQVPAGARAVVQTLIAAGYEAYLVGGAVRDVLLGRSLHDWDITTNATPEQVTGCFDRVIPTGMQHGTVTVLIDRVPFEVTTYRVDGEYTDGRRPDGVVFTPNLEEDLARRDFTINAMAWCPETDRLVDPFDGCRDLGLRMVRAVGDPQARLSEDGLRAMRAVRFAAVLDFKIEHSLELALSNTLEVFSKVSVERVAIELRKTLMSRRAAWGVSALRRTGLLGVFLPEIAKLSEAHFEEVCQALSRAPEDFETRVAVLLSSAGQEARALCNRLRWPKKTGEIVALLVQHSSTDLPGADDPRAVYGLARSIGRPQLRRFAGYRDAMGSEGGQGQLFLETCEQVKVDSVPLEVKELAIDGRTVIESLGIRPSKAVGLILEALLLRIWASPELNTLDQLTPMLPEIAREIGESP